MLRFFRSAVHIAGITLSGIAVAGTVAGAQQQEPYPGFDAYVTKTMADGKVAAAGDAAAAVAARLAARDVDVMLTDARLPIARHVALAAECRFRGMLRPLPAQPLYVDPPGARLPGAGQRPSAVG